MKPAIAFIYTSLFFTTLLSVFISCKKDSNATSASALQPGSMTALVNGKPCTLVASADTSNNFVQIQAVGVMNGTNDTIAFVASYQNSSLPWQAQCKGNFSDTVNPQTENWMSLVGGFRNTPANFGDYTDYAFIPDASLLIGSIISLDGGTVTGTLSGKLFPLNGVNNQGTAPDSLLITNGQFKAKF